MRVSPFLDLDEYFTLLFKFANHYNSLELLKICVSVALRICYIEPSGYF